MKKQFPQILFYGKPFIISLLLLLLFNAGFAQQFTGVIKGTVSDATGFLPGASIIIAGSQTGTAADNKGNYSLKLAPGKYTLVASFTGYTKAEVSIVVTAGNETVKNVTLVTNNLLQQVDVSYGTQSRRDITGSVS